MYNYLKALHIIFIVTWFAGMFYMPRLFIYNTEAQEKPEAERTILTNQFKVMMKRLWFGITVPSAVLTLIFGPAILFMGHWDKVLFQVPGRWLLIKLGFVVLLYAYFFSLHRIYAQQIKGKFKYSSQQLRVWNEVATILLIAIVFLAVVKNAMSWMYGLLGLLIFILLLMSVIQIYKKMRRKNGGR